MTETEWRVSDFEGKVALFWRWFATKADEFGLKFQNDALVAELDRRLADLGGFGWELSRGTSRRHSLAFSPSGSRDRLDQTRAIVSLAPPLPDWEFHPAKPPKDWQTEPPVFEMQQEGGGDLVKIDAQGWRYVILRYNDGFKQAVVQAPNTRHLSEHDRRAAAEIVLNGFLGEERAIMYIDGVEVVDELDEREARQGRGIAEIVKHVPEYPHGGN